MPGAARVQIENRTPVDDYWADMTVRSEPFVSAEESAAYIEWRAGVYPLFAEYMDMPGKHSGEVVLDYGCGPGNDTVHFLIGSEARKVIGIDVSEKALGLADRRIRLHDVDPQRFELLRSSDAGSEIPLDDESVDYVHCLGVIHHTTHPGVVLRELYRVLRRGGRGSIMVYNRQSIFFHLWIAYQRQLINGDFPDLNAEEAFSRSTDGEDCPIARVYRPDDFLELCMAAGFEAQFIGGYFATMELDLMRSVGEAALADERLGIEHRNFLRTLMADEGGLYQSGGWSAGHGGVFAIRKP